MTKTPAIIAASTVAVFAVGVAAMSHGSAPRASDAYGIQNMLAPAYSTAPSPPIPQLPTPAVRAPREPSSAPVRLPAWVKRWEPPVDRAIGVNGLPVPASASSSSSGASTGSSATGHNEIQTKCARSEITAATCKRDGYSGGYGPTSSPTSGSGLSPAAQRTKTECARHEVVTKATCKRDGYPGGK